MEHNIQQITENKLPIKTKIAAWILKISSFILLIVGILMLIFYFIFGKDNPDLNLALFVGLPYTILAVLFLISENLIFKRKKIGWRVSTIILSLLLAVLTVQFMSRVLDISLPGSTLLPFVFVSYFLIGFSFLPCIFLIFLTLILLLLDRKNFWKVAR